MPVLKVRDFSLSHTLECGQIFRVNKVGDWYYINVRDRLFKVQQNGDELVYEGRADEQFIKHFFSLDHDLELIYRKISLDEYIEGAIEKFRGLRILRQDPWECLISFLCSTASNIPRIKRTVESICEIFGDEIKLDDYRSWTFPAPGKLSDCEALKMAKAGFRADFIASVNSLVTEEYLKGLAGQPYETAKEKLKQLPGVADKVADCVLLFSLGFLKAFPVDTWVERAMIQYYFEGQKVSVDKIREFGQIYFGEYAGYAQQYLFYQARLAQAGQEEPEETSP